MDHDRVVTFDRQLVWAVYWSLAGQIAQTAVWRSAVECVDGDSQRFTSQCSSYSLASCCVRWYRTYSVSSYRRFDWLV